MTVSAITTRVLRHANAYFAAIKNAASQDLLVGATGSPVRPVYPTMLLLCETPTHYVVEFVGASETLERLRTVHYSLPSLAAALGQFPAPRSAHILTYPGRSTGCGIEHLTLLSEQGYAAYKSRYPGFPELHEASLMCGGLRESDEAFHPVGFTDELQDFWLRDVMMMAEWRGLVRARYFQTGFIVARSMSMSELKRQLDSHYPIGEDTALLAPLLDGTHHLLVRAANLASLAATDRVGETTITGFLELNSSILTTALGGARIIPQPSLAWIEGNPDREERAIQPDFLLVDDAGEAHLCEFKLPLLRRRDLTTGGHRRRRFIGAVAEGVAQLANYREYLSFESHQELLFEKYGVTVRDPRSILIVGSAENYDGETVRQAQRALAPFDLIDYDSLRVMYLLGSGYVPRGGSLS